MVEQVQPLGPGPFPKGEQEPKPAGIGTFGGLGQDEVFFATPQAVAQEGEVGLAGGDETFEAVQLGKAAGGLHVRDLQVVAKVRIDVLVVVALGKVAQLPAEAVAASVVLPGRTEAVAAPVPEGFQDLPQFGAAGEDRATLAHGEVVGRVEAEGADVAEGAHLLALVGGTQGIAAILHEPQPVLAAQRRDDLQVEGIAQGVGQHDRLGAGRDGRLDQGRIDVVGGQGDIHEDRHGAGLEDGVHRGGEAGGHADDLVAGPDGAVAQPGGGEGHEGHQVRRGPAVHREHMPDTQELGKTLLEPVVEAPRGQPAVEGRLHHVLQLRRAEHLARRGNRRFAGFEGLGGIGLLAVGLHEAGDLGTEVVEVLQGFTGKSGLGGGRLVGGNLIEGRGSHVRSGRLGPVPGHDVADAGFQAPPGPPVQPGAGLGDVELEEVGLVGGVRRGLDPVGGTVTPGADQSFHQLGDGLGVGVVGTEVPPFGEGGALLHQGLGQLQIAGQGFQHVLPGSYGPRAAEDGRSARLNGPEDIRH